MNSSTRAMNGVLVALLAVVGVLWIGLLGTFAWMHTGDPLSRRIAEPFAEYITIGLWVFLAAIALMTTSRVGMSIGAIAGVLTLLVFSLAAAFVTVRLSGDGAAPRWLMIVALAPPPLIGTFAIISAFAYRPGRAALASQQAPIWPLVMVLLTSILPWFFAIQNARRNAAEVERINALNTAKK